MTRPVLPGWEDPAMSPDRALEKALSVARQAVARDHPSKVVPLIKMLQQRYPENPDVWTLGSRLARRMGAVAYALEQAQQALSLVPGHNEANGEAAETFLLMERLEEARDCAIKAARGNASPQTLDRAAAVLSQSGQYSNALKIYDRLASQYPNVAGAHHNRASILRFLGRVEEAERAFDRAIVCDPDDSEAYLGRSGLRRQTQEDNHVTAIQAQLAKTGLSSTHRMRLNFALAKELEDIGEYADSFRALVTGNGLRRKSLDYSVKTDVDTMVSIIASFGKEYAASSDKGHDTTDPIFVLGLPRSGTTLTERIIGSHPEAEAVGELNAFPMTLVELARSQAKSSHIAKNEMVKIAATLSPQSLGSGYMERAAAWRTGAARFVDKLPMNYLYLGLIAKALPRAGIVEVKRHPMANAYAIYKTLFKAGYPFSYDFNDIAKYLAGYRQLMRHWSDVVAERIIPIQYETLIDSQESESRRLIESLGLPWDSACLDFHKNPTPSSTQSAAQVRKPIYSSSLAQWRNYEEELSPLRDAMIAQGIPADELD